MKTWIFDEDELNKSMKIWIEAQKSTGHAKAKKNADFIAQCILDFLQSSDSLYKLLDIQEIKPERFPISKEEIKGPIKEKSHRDIVKTKDEIEDITIEEMKASFYSN